MYVYYNTQYIHTIYTFVHSYNIYICMYTSYTYTYIYTYISMYIYMYIYVNVKGQKEVSFPYMLNTLWLHFGMCFTVIFTLSCGYVIKIEAPVNPVNQVWLKSTARLDLKRKDYIKRLSSQSGAVKFGV